MNPKHKPRPISSFVEDDFELKESKKSSYKEAIAKAARRDYTIAAIRIVMPLAAICIALWLYTMLDNFISHHQHQRFEFNRHISSKQV